MFYPYDKSPITYTNFWEEIKQPQLKTIDAVLQLKLRQAISDLHQGLQRLHIPEPLGTFFLNNKMWY